MEIGMEAMRRISWPRTLKASAWMAVGACMASGVLGLIGPIHFGKDAPAWVQAVGSVIAILVAIAVPLWVQDRERRLALEDKRLRVVSFSISMLPAAESFMSALRSALIIATDEDAPDGPDLNHAADTAKVPDALQAKVAELHEVGEPALPLMRAIVMSSQARSELRQAQFYYEHAGEYVDPYTGRPEDIDPPEPYDLTLRNCIEQLALALNGMRSVLQ
ncbi:hypothetical protein NX81_015740 [Xanthomonas vasicola]|uniref:hypothetical protein n=1 Tax=Xanthomonas vasicola TaxID=56459 RepID=UPI0005317944|nr:hypothetical protein [Xanthomonas vasicola]AZR23505.1 hypothetical protein NX81_015740 [Xanthomonas vasicola]